MIIVQTRWLHACWIRSTRGLTASETTPPLALQRPDGRIDRSTIEGHRSRVYLVLAYSKSVKADLTKAEENELRKLARQLEGEE